MTAIACLTALLALLSLRIYLRNRRLVTRLRRARSRCAHARAELAKAERFAGVTLIRSVKRRAALLRVARYCRAVDVTTDALIEAGIELGHQVIDRDAAIDAMTARIAELMPGRETSASIAAWQNETFGPATTTLERLKHSADKMAAAMFRASHQIRPQNPTPNLSRAIRAAEELAELICLLAIDDDAAKAPEEVADIDIVLRGIDAAHGVERATMVDAKMAKNRARRWALTGDGHGQHVSDCQDRIAFVDGELPADRAAAFRAHLRGCAACGEALPGDAGLTAQLSTLKPAPEMKDTK